MNSNKNNYVGDNKNLLGSKMDEFMTVEISTQPVDK